jgi:NitT/TauT family transport system ATP-binding protein
MVDHDAVLSSRPIAPGASTESVSPPPSPAAAPYVSIEQVEMSFPVRSGRQVTDLQVLDGIDLEIAQGEFCCFIGPSGCGKSTLLRIIDGLIKPTGGRVVVGGIPTTEPRSDLGVVFQSFNLFPWRTVAANVTLGLE